MRIEFDARLMEEAVFAAVRAAAAAGAPDRAAAYRRRLDTLYDLAPGSRERERGFRVLHAAWFEALGLEARVRDRVDEVPALARHCGRLLVDKALTARHEGAELFVRPDGDGRVRTAVVRLRPEFLGDEARVTPFLRRELRHLADMVDPAFGYRPTVEVDVEPAKANLLRDRYAVAWNASVDGRLARAGWLPGAAASDHFAAFERAFGAMAADAARALAGAAFADDQPTHARLAAWAAASVPALAEVGAAS